MRLIQSLTPLYLSRCGNCGVFERAAAVSPAAVHRIPVRHGTKRTSKTMHHDPRDYTRDIYAKVSKSLYRNPDDWAEEPQYPEIVQAPHTPDGIRYERRLESEKVAAIPSVLEKMRHFFITPHARTVHWKQILHHAEKIRVFWRPWLIPGFPDKYNILQFYQYLTHTALVSDQLPAEFYSQLDEATLNAIVEKVRLPVIDALLMQKKFLNKNLTLIPEGEQGLLNSAKNVVEALVRAVDIACAKEFPHLMELQVDTDTRCAALWKRSGFEKFKTDEFTRGATKKEPEGLLEFRRDWKTVCYVSGEHRVQFEESDKVFKLFRHENPLPQVVPRESSLAIAEPVPVDFYPCEEPWIPGQTETYQPGAYGFNVVEDKQYPQWIPGFWHGDPCEFSTLSIKIPASWERTVEKFGEESGFETMTANIVVGSFGRILAQAMYLGFSFLNELTYPITTQSICTNGRDWIFGTYQANTIAVWNEDKVNPYQNLCWVTKPLKLFERLDDDKVIDFNDEVLKHFIRQYLKSPVEATDISLRPYLLNTEKSYWKTEDSLAPFYHRLINNKGEKIKRPFRIEI